MSAISREAQIKEIVNSIQLPGEGVDMEHELNHWVRRAQELKPSARENYESQIRGYAHHAIYQIEKMKTCPQQASQDQIQCIADDFKRKCSIFFNTCGTYEQQKAKAEKSFAAMKDKIQQAGSDLSFAPFIPGIN